MPKEINVFEVEYTASENRLFYAMHGFWSLETVGALATALRDALAPLGPPPLRFDALCDASDFPVQSREVSEALALIMTAGRAIRTGRTAIVVGGHVSKLQADRTLGGDDLRTFLNRADAEAWLEQPA